MNCPKCNYEQHDNKVECKRCGVIFEKYYAMQKSLTANSIPVKASEQSTNSSISFREIFLGTEPNETPLKTCGQLIILIGVILWGTKFILSPIEGNAAGQSFLHLVNLPFHEAGHIFFRPFGSFIASLGGTLGQLMMPLICFFVLLFKTKDRFGASIALWWFGQNFFDIAPYINDARSLSLPLLGGNFGHSSPYGFHDWEYILTESGLIQYDHVLAKAAIVLGTICFLLSYSWGALLLYQQFKTKK